MNSTRIFLEEFSIMELELVSTLYSELTKSVPNIKRIDQKCAKLESKIRRADIFLINDPGRDCTGVDIVVRKDNPVLAKFMIDICGTDPLHFLPCQKKVMQVLLRTIDPDTVFDSNGNASLHVADRETTTLLLAHEANPNIKNSCNITPLTSALLYSKFDIARILFQVSSPITKTNALVFICGLNSVKYPGAASARWLLSREIFPTPSTVCIAILNRKNIIIEEFLDYSVPFLQDAFLIYNAKYRPRQVDHRINDLADYMNSVVTTNISERMLTLDGL